MSSAGLFSGTVTQSAPADNAPTLKHKGHHWMQWGVTLDPVDNCTAKYIEALGPTSQSYSKDNLWPASGNMFTFAGFYRVPDWHLNGGTFIKSTYFDVAFRYWYTGERRCAFDIDLYTPGYAGNYRLETKILYPELTIGEWFCLMYSIDTSPAGAPTRSSWLHKVGSNTPVNLFVGASRDDYATGPGTPFDFNDSSSKWTLGSNLIDPNRGQNYEQGNMIITDEYVDWDDQNNRDLMVNPLNGKPVGLGVDGSLLTGNAAKIYLAKGDGTDNGGTAGNFTVINGPIADAPTSPCDG